MKFKISITDLFLQCFQYLRWLDGVCLFFFFFLDKIESLKKEAMCNNRENRSNFKVKKFKHFFGNDSLSLLIPYFRY